MVMPSTRIAGLADAPRGHEVGFTDTKGDNVVHFRDEIEKATNAGRGDVRDRLG